VVVLQGLRAAPELELLSSTAVYLSLWGLEVVQKQFFHSRQSSGRFFNVSASHPDECENLINGAKYFLREQKHPIPDTKGHISHREDLHLSNACAQNAEALVTQVPRVDFNPLCVRASWHGTCNSCWDTMGIWRNGAQNCDSS